METLETEYLVIGSGIAGLTFALKAAKSGRVVLVTKKERSESNTNYAQGGIASVLGESDSFEDHVADTLAAGAGLCHPEAVDIMVREGPERIRELLDLGVPFVERDGSLDLGREGGHHQNRIVHCKDRTGKEVEAALLSAIRGEANIEVLDNHLAVNLILPKHLRSVPPGTPPGAVLGAYVMEPETFAINPIVARKTVLSTGGAGKVYLYTTNPDIATGDGVAMAYRAGARVANLEFIQFHPTCLYHPDAKSFLLSEALRGEGGVIINGRGEPFLEREHALKDLAPRDIVARAIDRELKSSGEKCVFLDLTGLAGDFLETRFPTITAKCLEFGIDIKTEPIPTVPAAHYVCGGVETDLEGRTSLPNLLALGEVSCTGVHGANRLASNSLLEALVFSHRAAEASRKEMSSPGERALPRARVWEEGSASPSIESVVLDHDWDSLRRIMWDLVGIVRKVDRLRVALARIRHIRETVERYYWIYRLNPDLVELRNIALIGDLITRSALARKESRGLHYVQDYPEPDDQQGAADTVLQEGQQILRKWVSR